tara:strand:+ start:15055 stop:15300 length:246 start_codon:yes stop_codon:yes gene_type:complete
MSSVPRIQDILKETQAAFALHLKTSTGWKERYGAGVYREALKAATVLALVKWAIDETKTTGGSTTDLVKAIELLTVAVYRS